MISRHFIMISRHIFVMISKHTAWLEDSGVSLKTSMKEAFSKISENLHENIYVGGLFFNKVEVHLIEAVVQVFSCEF